MKLTQIETDRLGELTNIIWVRLHTDEGLVGLGETFMGAQAVDAALGIKNAMQSASTISAPATSTCAARSTRTRPTGGSGRTPDGMKTWKVSCTVPMKWLSPC